MALAASTSATSLRRLLPNLPAGIWSLSGFTLLWFVGIVVPLIGILVFSFLQTKGLKIDWNLSIKAYEKLFFYGGGPLIGRTVRIAATMTVIELLLAFPFALWLAKGARNQTLKLLTFTALTVPFFLSPVARVVVWRSVMSISGLVNTGLMDLGIVDEPVDWLIFSEFAVHLGYLGQYFPAMVWPIFLSVALIDDEYLEASKDLGASRLRTLIHVILPLSLPGIVAGVIFTFVPMLGDTVVPQQMGGGNVLMISHNVYNMIGASNFVMAAALAAIILAIMLAFQVLLWAALRPVGGLNNVFASLKR
jgi:ABC-type spermidine/putrescine transport system permease subunit I